MPNGSHSLCLGLGLVCVSVAGAIALGCGSEVRAPSTSSGVGIKGSYIDTYISDSGEMTIPHSAEGLTLEALVPQPDKSWKRYNGELQADGTFEIADVPAGTYYLKVQEAAGGPPTFYVTGERSIELGSNFRRRHDAKPATIVPTSLVLNVAGLSPWQLTDSVELYSPGSGAFGSLSFFSAMPGMTTVDGAVSDVTDFSSPNLIDGAKGDVAYITQLVLHDTGALAYESVDKVLKPTPFTQVDGQTVMVGGSFEDAPQKQLKVEFKRSLFAELASEVSPSASMNAANVFIYAEPGGASRRTAPPQPTLLLYYDQNKSNDFDTYMAYGNPFPEEWDTVAVGLFAFNVYYAVPGAETPTLTRPRIDCRASIRSSGEVSFAPSIRPVKNVLLNGSSASSDRAGVGLSPTVSWSAPAEGTPGHYRVVIRRLYSSSDLDDVALFIATGTELTVPEGVLEEGGYYYFKITADTVKLVLGDRSVSSGYGCYVDAVTGLISP